MAFCIAVFIAVDPILAADFTGTCTGTIPAAGSPHNLVGTCTVPAGETLTVETGATLLGAGQALIVEGSLNAAGATFDNVRFLYRDGGGGLVESSTLTGSSPVTVSSTSSVSPAVPVLRANTILSTSTAIRVDGTARPALENNTITTNSWGILYTGTSAGTASGNQIGFTLGSGSNRVAIEVGEAASPIVSGNTILDDPSRGDQGIVVNVDVTSTVRVTDNSICSTTNDLPMILDLAFFSTVKAATLSGTVFPCGVGLGLGIEGHTGSPESLITPVEGQSRFYVQSNVFVDPGERLTVQPGIAFDSSSSSRDLFVDGTLDANGVTFNNFEVVFRDSGGGLLEANTFSGFSTVDFTTTLAVGPAAPILRNNTFVVTGSAIRVDGTARPTIENNTITTNSRGISYFNTAAGTATGNEIRFTLGGSSSRIGIEIDGFASPVVTANTVFDDPTRSDVGIEVDVSPASTAQVTGNDVCSTGGDTPIRVSAGLFADSSAAVVSGNVLSCGLGDGFGLIGSTFSQASTLGAVNGQSSFRLVSTVTVAAGQTLTIAPGLTLAGSHQDVNVQGTLNASGVTFDHVDIFYQNGSGGLVEASTFTGTNPIDFSSSSILDPATPILRGNTFTVTSVAIRVDGTARPTIENNTITTSFVGIEYFDSSGGSATGNRISFDAQSSSGTGIHVGQTASPLVDGNTILDNPGRGDVGVNLDISVASTVRVTGNDICSTAGDTPIRLSLGYFASTSGAVVSGNVLSCGVGAGFGLFGSTQAAVTTLAAVNGQTSFVLDTTFSVRPGETLTLPPGFRLVSDDADFGGQRNVFVDGTLDANGVTFDHVGLVYRDGSGGTVESSVLTASTAIDFSGASPTSPASPVFRGNTVTVSSTAFRVDGTARPVIESNTITTNGVGITWNDDSGGSATGNVIGFAAGTFSRRTAIEVNEAASPLVDANTILDDPDKSDVGIALRFLDPANSAVVTGNQVCSTGDDEPFVLDPDFFADASLITFSGNTLPCGAGLGTTLSSSLATDATLGPVAGSGLFRIPSSMTVSAGRRLSIVPGVEIRGEHRSFFVDGTLEVDGVTFVDTEIEYRATGTGSISNSRFEGPASHTAVRLVGSSPPLDGNTFIGTNIAVDLEGVTNVSITGNRFEANHTAIEVSGIAALSNVSGNVFANNTQSLRLATDDALFSAFPTSFATNTFAGSAARDFVLLPSTIDDSGTFPSSPMPYKSPGHVSISGGAQVVLPAGTVVASDSFGQFIVNDGSRLVAVGTAERPVVFTDFDVRDNSRWSGLVIRGDLSILEHCIIEFSGSDGLRLESASIPVTFCTITDNNDDGIELTGDSTPVITESAITMNRGDGVVINLSTLPLPGLDVFVEDNSIFSNGGFGIRNFDAFDVRATLNYWGHDSGPFDNSDDTAAGGLFNPAGSGENVSDRVSYDPWIRIGPSQEGVITPISGGSQSAPVGSTLPAPLVVGVESFLGTPLEGIEVIFSVTGGDATIVEPQPLLTGADGRAAATVRLGLTPGPVEVAVTARDVNSPLATFMGTSDAPARVGLVAEPLVVDVEPGVVGQPGDANGDGRVNNQDSAAIQAVIDGLLAADSPLLPTFPSGDINGDGRVDGDDVLVIQGFQVGLIDAAAHRPAAPTRQEAAATVSMVLPTGTLSAGETFEVPVYVEAGAFDLASYALEFRYSSEALELLDVEGAAFAGFAHPPLANRSAGRLRMTAINRGFVVTPEMFEVARLRFEVRETHLEAAEVTIAPSPGGGLVDSGRFQLVPASLAGSGTVHVVPTEGPLLIFADGFESGNTGAWTRP